MSISIEQVEHIASLARLCFNDAEKNRLAAELTSILEYVEKLNALDTAEVEPLSYPVDICNVFREDIAGESLSQSEALKNAPDALNGFFKVPKVIK